MVVVTRPHSPRRMANLLRTAEASDPFTPNTARALITTGKLTAFGGLGTWILSQIAQAVLSGTMLTSPGTFKPHQAPLAWLAVGLIFAALGQILDLGGHAGRTGHRHLMTEAPEHRISVHRDELLQAKGMTLVELSSRVGVTVVNLSILKNGRARAIGFNTLTAICDALGCTPGELLRLDH